MRARTIVAALLSASVALAGCSGDGDEVVTDDQATPEQALARAAARTFEGSGRFEMVFEDPDGPDWRAEGEFSGEDLRVVTHPDGTSETETTLSVDGVSYMEVTTPIRKLFEVPEGTKWLRTDPADDGGDDWSNFGPDTGLPFGGGQAAQSADIRDIGEAFASATGAKDDGTEEIDGVSYRRLRATLPGSALLPDDLDPPDELPAGGAEMWEKLEAVGEALLDRVTIDATVLIHPDGWLRRATMVTSMDAPEDAEDCLFLSAMIGMEATMTLDLHPTDERLAIEAPDPSTVSSWDEVGGSLFGEDPSFGDGYDGPVLETSDGPVPKDYVLEELELDAELVGIDPAALPTMSDEELVQHYDRLMALYEQDMADSGVIGSDVDGGDVFDDLFGEMLEGCPT
jgi:hypothetical protein